MALLGCFKSRQLQQACMWWRWREQGIVTESGGQTSRKATI